MIFVRRKGDWFVLEKAGEFTCRLPALNRGACWELLKEILAIEGVEQFDICFPRIVIGVRQEGFEKRCAVLRSVKQRSSSQEELLATKSLENT